MKFNVGDLLITKDDREEVSDTEKIFLILKVVEDDNEGYLYDLISQETGSISEWNYGTVYECFDKV